MGLPHLPVEFTERMRRILGEEYGAFEKSYEEVRKYGLRVNTKKISPEEFERIAPFHLTPIPWIPGGYYYLEEDAPARHPFYYAGLYYLQEPSAMTPASILDVEPGERVLDLCAAPGGKATALGAKLQGRGLLVANDISASRCRALLKNIEVFGIPNSFVSNGVPARLEERFPEFFDKILVDAPCSGEGMFRKDSDTIRAWYPEKPGECAKIQKDIVLRAADMLRPGGTMLYSTCTFAPEENEELVRYLLEQRPRMRLETIPYREGFSQGLEGMEQCVRLWPHKMGGEGHFMALLRKQGIEGNACGRFGDRADKALEGNERANKGRKRGKVRRTPGDERNCSGKGQEERQQQAILQEFFREVKLQTEPELLPKHMEIRSGQVYLAASLLPEVSGIPFLRNGLYLGELKKNRFEPSQSLAMALDRGSYASVLDLDSGDQRIFHYLRGETIDTEPGETARAEGWQLVCVNGYPLGWGKLVNGLLKNKYHPGWRMA
ncbi:MAG: RsmB/NOP family class I SAM-dependent RNA methyltransferase [Lachnospiraceae bacterium]|nr:RsmB/NOP family class I SAM-dependent RNA methyltransferase [Lachnospiraceae bacterium]